MNIDTDLEIQRYQEATDMLSHAFNPEELVGLPRQYNPLSRRNLIMQELPSGGYVQVGEEDLPQPQVMSTAPQQPTGLTRLEEAQKLRDSFKKRGYTLTQEDLEAAGLGDVVFDDVPDPRPQEVATEQIQREGPGQLKADPTIRDNLHNFSKEVFMNIGDYLGYIPGIPTNVEFQNFKIPEPMAEQLAGFVSGRNNLGVGAGDFVGLGSMTMEEGARTFEVGAQNDDKLLMALGALEYGLGVAEALPAFKPLSQGIKEGLRIVRQRLNQPGPMPTVGSNFGNFGQDKKRSFYVKVRSQGAENENAKNQVLAISQGKKPKIDDLATYFEQNHLKIYGRQLDPYKDSDFDLALDAAEDEILYQLDQAVSGRGWYDSDVRQTFEILAETPGLEVLANDESLRVLWSALAAPTSIGNLVKNNTRAATAAFLEFLETGKVPVTPPAKGAVTQGLSGAGWGAKGKSVAAGMRVISHLVETKGVDGFADWWLSPHTLKELTEVRKAAGLGGPPSGLAGGQDSIHLGAMILGDKTGRYSLNINGYQGTTKDSWFSRSYNRHFGNMRMPDGTVANQPRNLPERARMEEFTARLVDKLAGETLSEQDAQAVLWFHEQNLFTDLGVLSRPGSFSEAAEKIRDDLRSGVRTSDENQVGAQSSNTELTEFRSITAPKRTVRSQRRSGQVAGETSGPYTRGRGEGSEGTGLLVLKPDEQTQRIYNKVGISLPTINEVPADEAAAKYNADMTSAMTGHKFGAQVEIKSVEDLSNARLFRTENGSGFAIKPDGDIVAVFQAENETGSVGYSMIQAAVAAGGNKLDAFDTFLPGIYETAGFKPVARIAWEDEFAPDNWDKATFAAFNNGEPDVIFFVYDPTYFGGVKKSDVPLFNTYDEAVAAQDAALKE